jgi:hypothetical protein
LRIENTGLLGQRLRNMTRRLVRAFWVLLALIFLFEAWLWDHLQPVVASVVDLVPWNKLKAKLADLIHGLSPSATLVVFAVPAIILFPMKLLEVWLLAHRHWFAAITLLVFAKLVGVGVTAFIFDVTREKVLQIAWFRRLYDYVMWLRDWAHEMVEPVRQRLKQWLRVFAPGQTSRAFRLLMRLRRRMQTHVAS